MNLDRNHIEFKAWPKTARLLRNIVITEKIDGTNAAIQIVDAETYSPLQGTATVILDGKQYYVHAQSRKRLIRVGDDNFGFAAWVWDNANQLAQILGPGTHYGEWWGRGIQRGYNTLNRHFSLFNTAKWKGLSEVVGGETLTHVPVLYEGVFDQAVIEETLIDLQRDGSVASLDYPNPEGICVYHTQSNTVYKVTLDNNDAGKWENS